MSSVEPVRMLDAEPHPSFELTELDAPEEELLGRYLPIGDVAKSIGVNPSVLRFWEQEFPQLRPTKRGNRRYYCSEDVALIRTIQHLLYEEHYTILGARNKIHELQIQDKVKETGILDAHTSAPMRVAPKKPEVDLGAILAELKAIREVLTTAPNVAEKARQERLAKEEADRHAVENFALVSQDLYAMMAEEAKTQEKEPTPVQEEVQVAPLSYDLGALGAESEDFLTPSPMIGKMTIRQPEVEEPKPVETPAPEDDPCPFDVPEVQETVVEPEPKVEEVKAVEQETKPVEPPKVEPKVEERKPQLVVPPLPSQQKAFTIGMRVQTQKSPSSLIHSSPVYWKK